MNKKNPDHDTKQQPEQGASSLDSISEEKSENGPPAYLKSTEVFDVRLLRDYIHLLHTLSTSLSAA